MTRVRNGFAADRTMRHPGTVFEDLIEGNKAHVHDYEWAHLGAVPSRHLAVLTCMDTRLDPLDVLGLRPGEAHIVRIAGARCTPEVIASLRQSVQMGTTRIAVIRHTDCRAASANPDADLANDIEVLRSDDVIATATIGGFVYDVRTGALSMEL